MLKCKNKDCNNTVSRYKFCSPRCYWNSMKGIKKEYVFTKEHREKISKAKKGQGCSEETKRKISQANKGHKGLRGKESPNWKENVGYGTIHDWIRNNYGKPFGCDQCHRQIRSQYALVRGKTYERKRENFIKLCSSCHWKYDHPEKVRVRPKCIDCDIQLKDFYAKRCNSHAQRERFRKT